jgi:hypothetical protein
MAAMDEVILRAVLDETKLGAAALGLCIARTLGERDPTLQQRLGKRADQMHRRLCEQGNGHAGEIVAAFAFDHGFSFADSALAFKLLLAIIKD